MRSTHTQKHNYKFSVFNLIAYPPVQTRTKRALKRTYKHITIVYLAQIPSRNSNPLSITLNTMFDTIESTISDDDAVWSQSFTAIDKQLSGTTVPTPFRYLIATNRGDIPENSFILLLHDSGDISIYYSVSDNRLVRRTDDLCTDTPDVVYLDSLTMTCVLT